MCATGGPMRDAEVVRRGLAACSVALPEAGILVVQDATLPTVTTIVTGEPVRGSWWAHDQAHSIFDVLGALESDTTGAKLVARKQTLVHRSRWPALAAVGGEGALWQYDGVGADARSVTDQVTASAMPARADTLTVTGARPRADVVRDVERRLLVHTDEVHTESGRHAKVLQSWASWAATVGLVGPLPDPDSARAAFEAAVRTFAPDRFATLLPWPVEVP